MFAYLTARLVSCAKADPFNDEEGKPVVYYVNTLKTEDGVLTVNSKDSFEEQEDAEGVAKLRIRQLFHEDGRIKGVKLTLAAFRPGDSIAEGEGTVA